MHILIINLAQLAVCQTKRNYVVIYGLRWELSRSIITLLLLVPTVAVGAPPCSDLTPQEGSLGYKLRSDRCEGLFVQDALSNVRLKSLLAISGDLPQSNKDTLSVESYPGIPSTSYQLRVSSLDPRIHYQLDAFMPEQGPFNWSSSEIISRVVPPISPSILAPLVWKSSEPAYYVPVVFPRTDITLPMSGAESVVAIIESTVPIQQYSASLTADEGGQREKLTTGSDLPTSRLELAIPRRDKPGLYTLWLRVRLLGESQPEGQSWVLWLP